MDRRTFLKAAVLGGTACTIGSGWATNNDGLYSDIPGGAGTFRYQVAETGSGRLSNEVAVTP